MNSQSTPYALYLHAGYQDVSIALTCKPDQIVATILLPKARASSLLIPEMHQLLDQYHLSLDNLVWIGAHVGPAPFTTLRTVLATLNGLSWARPLPLIGVNGLSVWSALYPDRMIVLNAFCGEVYLGYHDTQGIPQQACLSLADALDFIREHIAARTSARLQLMGNGAQLYQQQLLQELGHSIDIIDDAPLEAAPSWCIYQAWQTYNEGSTTHQLEPIYLKSSSSVLKPYDTTQG